MILPFQVFHVYMAGTEGGPVVFCLHGGGYSGYVQFFVFLFSFVHFELKHLVFGSGF